jgi:hypothetical protein
MEIAMTERWFLRGTQFANCNCAWGCPCQFNSPTTHGHCEAIEAGHNEEGEYNGTRLDPRPEDSGGNQRGPKPCPEPFFS